MNIENTTYSNQQPKPLTIEDLKKAAKLIVKKEEKPLPKGLSWFTKLMARFGWHRKYELIIFDSQKINSYLPQIPPKP